MCMHVVGVHGKLHQQHDMADQERLHLSERIPWLELSPPNEAIIDHGENLW